MGHSEPLGNREKTSRGEEAEEEGVCGRRRRCSLFFFCWHSLMSSWPIGGQMEPLDKWGRKILRAKTPLLCAFGYLLSLYQPSLGRETCSVQLL